MIYFSQKYILKKKTKEIVEKNINFGIISKLFIKTSIFRLPKIIT